MAPSRFSGAPGRATTTEGPFGYGSSRKPHVLSPLDNQEKKSILPLDPQEERFHDRQAE